MSVLLMRVAIMPQFTSAELLATHLCFVLCELLVAVPRPITGNIEYVLVSQVVFILATSAVYCGNGHICIVLCRTTLVVMCECILRTSYLVLVS